MRLLSGLGLAVSALFLAVGVLGLLGNVVEPEPYMVRAAIALCLAGVLGVFLAIITMAFPGKKHGSAKMLLVTSVAVSWPWSSFLVYSAFVAPMDKHGNRPDDVVRNFIELCEAEDHAAAAKLYCGPSGRATPTIQDFCERYKKIGLKNCEISSASRGKAGYWTVQIDFEEDGEKRHYFFYFKIVDGEWYGDTRGRERKKRGQFSMAWMFAQNGSAAAFGILRIHRELWPTPHHLLH